MQLRASGSRPSKVLAHPLEEQAGWDMPSALWPMTEAFPLAGHPSRGFGWHSICWQKPSHVECPGLPELLPAQVTNVDGCEVSLPQRLGLQASPCLIPRSEDILRGSLVTIIIVPHYEAFKFCLCFHDHNFYLPRQLLSPVKLPSGVGSYYQDLETIPLDSFLHNPSSRPGTPKLGNVFSGTHSRLC